MPRLSKGRIVNEDKVFSRKGVEVHEVQAQITVPHEGGWGWVVVCCSFVSIFILDGIAFTFGCMLSDISKDYNQPESVVALVNSTAVAIYFLASPLASAFINRYGFRACSMSGSIICAFSLLITYFSCNYTFMFIFYGLTAGFGYSLINMSTALVVGFYFEKLRSVALAIATCGSSIGVMACYPINSYLVKLGGWRPTTLLHSGLIGLIFFLSMVYRPLLSVTVTRTEEEVTRALAYLPSVTSFRSTNSSLQAGPQIVSTTTERLFKAVSNINYPTAAKVVDTGSPELNKVTSEIMPSFHTEPGPSKAASIRSKLTLTIQGSGPLSQMQLKKAQSISSKVSEITIRSLNLAIPETPQAKKSLLRRILHWEPHEHRARPLYRDDAFYTGKLTSLPAYQKSMIEQKEQGKTGLEYQMAVTRAVTMTDLHDQRGILTTAIRRVLATMMDPTLLKSKSFLLMCCSGFFTYVGFLVPYVYLQDRNLKAGLDPHHCTLFISAIGFSNAVGRLVLGSIANKMDPIKMFAFWCSVAGISTIISDVSYNVIYQYFYCCLFGFSTASVACLRSVILVSLYGLDRLTNATGMMLIFLGFGNLISTPLAGILKQNFGYSIAFYSAGGFMTLSGLILIAVKFYSEQEKREQQIHYITKQTATTTYDLADK